MASIAMTVGVMAYATDNSFFFLLFAMLLGMICVSYVFSQWMLKNVTVSHVLPDRGYATFPFTVRLTLRNRKKWLPSFAVGIVDHYESKGASSRGRAFVVAIGRGQEVTASYQLNMFRRGVHKLAETELQTSFPFGMFRARVRVAQERTVLIYPKVGDVDLRQVLPQRVLNVGARASSLRGYDNFHSLREFRWGDNSKLIHWRVTARVGKTMLKEMDREQVKNVTLVLDTRVEPVPKRYRRYLLERGVSLAATLAQKLAVGNFGVDFVAFAPGFCHQRALHKQAIPQVLDVLATLDASETSIDALVPQLRNVGGTMIVLRLSQEPTPEFSARFPNARELYVDAPEVRAMFSRRSLLLGLVDDDS